jgi:hypothetical protein
VLILFIAAGITLAFAGALIGGRLGGLGVTVLFGVTLAFFWMPPRFSLRVAPREDIYALAFYGAAGLVLAETAPSKKKKLEPIRPYRGGGEPRQRLETRLSSALETVMSSELGERLRALDVHCPAGSFSVPCTLEETGRLLADVATAAVQTPAVRRISIYPGQRPGGRQLTVVAHCVFPAPLRSVVTIGKRDSDCEPRTFPGWPPRARVTTFDNGYGRIFQISILEETTPIV